MVDKKSETSGNVVRQKKAVKKPKNIYFSMYSNYLDSKCENGS